MPQKQFVNLGAPNGDAYKRRNVAFMPYLPQTLYSSGTRTHSLMTTAPGEFDGVALILCNIGAAFTLSGALVAVSESNVSKTVPRINGASYNALAAAGTQNGFKPVTFGGAATVSVPVGTVMAPAFLVSDFIDLASIPRVDGGALPLLLIRQFFNATSYPIRNTNSAAATDLIGPAMAPHEHYPTQQNGDGVTDPSLYTATWTPGANSNAMAIFGFIIRSRKSGHTLVVTGDSIANGGSEGTTDLDKANDLVGSWNHRAYFSALQALQYPVGYVNVARDGDTPASYGARFKSLVSAGVPVTRMIYPAWSPNPFPPSTGLSFAQDLYDYSRANRFEYMLTTPTPYYAYETARAKARLDILAASPPNNFVLDFNQSPAYQPPVGELTWVAAYNLDNTHPNAAGHAVLGQWAAPKLREFIDFGQGAEIP